MEEERGLQRDKGQKGVRRMEEGRKRDKRVKRRGEKEKKEDVGRGDSIRNTRRLYFGWSCAISERWGVGEGYLAQGEMLDSRVPTRHKSVLIYCPKFPGDFAKCFSRKK